MGNTKKHTQFNKVIQVEIMGDEGFGRTTGKKPTFSVYPSSPKSSPFTSSSSSSKVLATSSQRRFSGDKDETETLRSGGSSVDSVFGSVPTRLEVEYAIAAFQSFMMQSLSSSLSMLDRVQPISKHQDPKLQQSTGSQMVYDAFHLLQTVSSVRKMVVSISSDKTVWNAVLGNNEVQEFRKSLQQAKANRPESSTAEPDLISMILKWILDNMKVQVLQLIETLKSLLINKSFESLQSKSTIPELKQGFEELIVSTVLLSTITLMIVLVTRAYAA